MPALILPRRFYSQPQEVVDVDWRNPVTRGLLWAFNPASGTFYDAVGKINYSPSTITKAVSSIGVADDYSARFQPSGIAKLPASGDLSVFVQAAPNSTQQSLLCQRQGNNTNHIEIRSGSGLVGASTNGAFFKCSSTGQGVNGTLTLDERWHTFAGTLSGSTASLYIDGAFTDSTTITTPASDIGVLTFGGLSDSTVIPYTGLMGVVCAWTRAVSSDEIAALSANPWQLFRAKPRVLYFDVGGGGTTHNLAADAAAAASAAAALSVSVPLAAAALSVATAGGAMSVSIPLAGAAAGEASATGDLSTTGTADLAAAATATANASGGLSLSIPLAGSAVAQALASAGITQGVPLAGDAAGTAGASGALTLNISLAGAAIAEAAANAGLSVLTSGLAGDAVASASASAALTHAVPLSGASLAVSSASGNLTQLVPLSGAAASASMATGGLDVSVQLSAAALAQAMATAGLTVDGGMSGAAAAEALASGTLTLRVNLDGAAVAQAIASGALTAQGLLTQVTPGWEIAAPARSWKIDAPMRNWRIST